MSQYAFGNRYAAAWNSDNPIFRQLPKTLKAAYRWREIDDLALQCLVNESRRSQQGKTNLSFLPKRYDKRYRNQPWQKSLERSVRSKSARHASKPLVDANDSVPTNIVYSPSSAVQETVSV